jgi:hypothetical protein
LRRSGFEGGRYVIKGIEEILALKGISRSYFDKMVVLKKK